MPTAVITILFTDLVGSTELFQSLGEQEAQRVRREHFRVLRESLAANAGREVKTIGDSLMAAFETPTEAIACAIDMQHRMDRFNDQAGPRLALRVGVNVGEAALEDGDYFGTAVQVAKALSEATEEPTILVSELVRALVGSPAGFAFKTAGPFDLPGIDDPVPAFEILWEPAVEALPLPTPLAVPDRAPFVGRSEERRRMRAALDRARIGARSLVMIAGEPGIGKTRMAMEFARALHAGGSPVFYGRCDEEGLIPLQPFVEAVRFYVRHADPQRLAEQIGQTGGDLVRLIPEIKEHLPGIEPPPSADPETARYRLFEAFAALLTGAATGEAPPVLILDDLHWADSTTLHLLKHLVRAPGAGLLIIGTYRDVELERRHPLAGVLADLRRDATYERIALHGLTRDEIGTLLAARAEHDLDPSAGPLVDALHRETEGNPFFIREIIRHLADTGAIFKRDGRWTSDLGVEEFGLPEGIREVIGRRLARLSDRCNETLRLASVVGRSFPLNVLENLSDSNDVLDSIQEAVTARVITESPEELDRYSFSHALIRETLYGEIATSRRVRLHAKITSILEDLHPHDPPMAELAYHCHEAASVLGDQLTCVAYARKAGEHALDVLAFEEAARHYERALEMLTLMDVETPEIRADLLMGLAEARLRAGELPGTKDVIRQAVDLIRTIGDPVRLANAALGYAPPWSELGMFDPYLVELLDEALEQLPEEERSLRAKAHARIAIECAFLVEASRSIRHAEEAVRIARTVNDPQTLCYALIARRHASTGPAALAERRALTEEAIAAAQRAGDGEMLQRARGMYTVDLMQRGDIDAYDQVVSAFVSTSKELQQPFYLYIARLIEVGNLVREGRAAEARALLGPLSEIADQQGRTAPLLGTRANLHLVNWLDGQPRDGWDERRQLFEAAVNLLPPLGPFVASYFLLAGAVDDASRIYHDTVEEALQVPPTSWLWVNSIE